MGTNIWSNVFRKRVRLRTTSYEQFVMLSSQSDGVFVFFSWSLLFVPVDLVSKGVPHVSVISTCSGLELLLKY